MKVTQFGPGSFPLALAGWSTGVLSVNSNFNTEEGLSATNFVQRITANSSNVLLNPIVNFASGSNILLTLDQGPLPAQAYPSNTIRIHSTGGGGGNIITSNGSNSLAAVVNLVAGSGIALGVSGQNITITNTGSGGGGGGGIEPWLIETTFLVGAHGNTNWSTFNQDGAELYSGDMESSGAQNDEIYWDVGFSGGTWDMTLLHYMGPNRGIYTVSIDGNSIGTIDGYAAGATRNQYSTLTGVSISAGKRRLKFKMATKNGSSSSYFGTAQAWQFRRTA